MTDPVLPSADDGRGSVSDGPVSPGQSRWTALPKSRSPRWFIPQTPRAAARNGLRVYRPLTSKGLLAWEAARVAASLGVFNRLGPSVPPPPEVGQALAAHIPPGGTFAVSKSNHPGRWVALLITESGRIQAVAKVATNDRMKRALEDESNALENLAPLLPYPVKGPRVLARESGLILLQAVNWRSGVRPWTLPREVAYALGVFYRRSASEDRSRGGGHGDFAPWNLFRTPPGWTILDWEHAQGKAEPFFDILHYVTMAHSLLGHPSRKAVLQGLAGEGWIGRALLLYGEGARLPLDDLPDIFVRYLESRERLHGDTRADRLAMRARAELLEAMGSRARSD